MLKIQFREWFKQIGTVDFWDESNAPEELSRIAKEHYMPQLRIAVEALKALALVTPPEHAKIAVIAIEAIGDLP